MRLLTQEDTSPNKNQKMSGNDDQDMDTAALPTFPELEEDDEFEDFEQDGNLCSNGSKSAKVFYSGQNS